MTKQITKKFKIIKIWELEAKSEFEALELSKIKQHKRVHVQILEKK